MAFSIHNLERDAGDSVLYEPGFRRVIETHLPILRSSPLRGVSAISADKIHQYEGDFYGLLCELGVPYDRHWIYLRVNGFENPNQFGRELRLNPEKEYRFDLISPPDEALTDLRSLYLTVR